MAELRADGTEESTTVREEDVGAGEPTFLPAGGTASPWLTFPDAQDRTLLMRVDAQRGIREAWHQRIKTLESVGPAIHGADQRELEITPEDVGVRAGLQDVVPGDHARELLLNPVANLGLDEQVVAQPSQRIGRNASRHLEILRTLRAGVSIRACPRDPLVRRHAELGGAKREQHGRFERERRLPPLVGASERQLETAKTPTFDQRLNNAGGG